MNTYFEVKKRTNRKGLSEIYLTVSSGRVGRKMLKTGIQIPPSDWNHDRQEVRRRNSQYKVINQAIKAKKREIDELIYTNQAANPDFGFRDFLELVEGKRKVINSRPKSLAFLPALDAHIESMKDVLSKDTIKDFHSLKKHLTGFEKHSSHKLTWSSMDYVFYEEFKLYLSTKVIKRNGERGLAKNTVGKQIKNLKAFLRKSMLRGDSPSISLEGWKVETEEVDHVYLTEEELEIVYNKDMSDSPRLEEVRDLFILGCETGLRISDFTSDLRFAFDNEVDGAIRYTVQKTMQRVIIPVTQRMREILDKYNGVLPKVEKFRFNREIKVVLLQCGITSKVQVRRQRAGEKSNEWIPKWKLVSSHTCRRSFCTNAYKRGWKAPMIRQVSGHTTDKALMRYIKVDAHEAAEDLVRELLKEQS